MRTFTVVPSFEGESAFFELPDIGFQGDHLSFAILFNLTELTEHWPNILPSMIVTNPKGETFIAPHTRWNAETHIFTWLISSTETAYDGYVKCQLKCMSEDDPETVVCMSRICQTRVFQSLATTDDQPEAFQSWIDTLAQLGAEITANASVVLEGVEATEINARNAQNSADAAEFSRIAAESARNQTERTAQIATSAQEAATSAQQRAQNSATAAEEAKSLAIAAKASAEAVLENVDVQAAAVERNAQSASNSADQAGTYSAASVTARNESVAAKEAAIIAKESAERAQQRSETAEEGAQLAQRSAESAQSAAETAQTAAETAQTAAETAQTAAETAQSNAENSSETAKKWAIGKDLANNDVLPADSTYHNNSQYWSIMSSQYASQAESARDTIYDVAVSTAVYDSTDESVTIYVGGEAVAGSSPGT